MNHLDSPLVDIKVEQLIALVLSILYFRARKLEVWNCILILAGYILRHGRRTETLHHKTLLSTNHRIFRNHTWISQSTVDSMVNNSSKRI